jgi:hypothetical protein
MPAECPLPAYGRSRKRTVQVRNDGHRVVGGPRDTGLRAIGATALARRAQQGFAAAAPFFDEDTTARLDVECRRQDLAFAQAAESLPRRRARHEDAAHRATRRGLKRIRANAARGDEKQTAHIAACEAGGSDLRGGDELPAAGKARSPAPCHMHPVGEPARSPPAGPADELPRVIERLPADGALLAIEADHIAPPDSRQEARVTRRTVAIDFGPTTAPSLRQHVWIVSQQSHPINAGSFRIGARPVTEPGPAIVNGLRAARRRPGSLLHNERGP